MKALSSLRILSFVLITAVFTSCGKENLTPITPTVKMVERVIKSVRVNNATNETVTTQYAYNQDGTVSSVNINNRIYNLYYRNGRLATVTNGEVTWSYVYKVGSVLPDTIRKNNQLFVCRLEGNVYTMTADGNSSRLQIDNLNVLDDEVSSYTYDVSKKNSVLPTVFGQNRMGNISPTYPNSTNLMTSASTNGVTENFIYEYNANGYPTKRTSTSNTVTYTLEIVK
jgi:hypothetical protein